DVLLQILLPATGRPSFSTVSVGLTHSMHDRRTAGIGNKAASGMGDPLALTSMACAVPYRRPISIELCHTVECIQALGRQPFGNREGPCSSAERQSDCIGSPDPLNIGFLRRRGTGLR